MFQPISGEICGRKGASNWVSRAPSSRGHFVRGDPGGIGMPARLGDSLLALVCPSWFGLVVVGLGPVASLLLVLGSWFLVLS